MPPRHTGSLLVDVSQPSEKESKNRAFDAHVSWFDRVCLTAHVLQKRKNGALRAYLVEASDGFAGSGDVEGAHERPHHIRQVLWSGQAPDSNCSGSFCLNFFISTLTSIVVGGMMRRLPCWRCFGMGLACWLPWNWSARWQEHRKLLSFCWNWFLQNVFLVLPALASGDVIGSTCVCPSGRDGQRDHGTILVYDSIDHPGL